MKKHWCILWITILGLGFTLGATAEVWAAPMVMMPFKVRPTLVSYDPLSGRVELNLAQQWFLSDSTLAVCDYLVTVRFDSLDNLQNIGPEIWTVPVEVDAPPVTNRVSLIIPTHDTSGFKMFAECGQRHYDWHVSFITRGDSLEVHNDFVRNRQDVIRFPLPDSVQRRLVYEEMQRQLEVMRNTPPPPMGVGSYGTPIYPGDSALADSLTDRGKGRLASMRALEREPLVDDEIQTWEIEDRWFQRLKGERRFRRIEGHTNEEWLELARQQEDSLDRANADKPLEIFVDLRKPEDEAFMRAFVDSLTPTDSAGFYRTVVLYRQLRVLGENKIRYRDASAGMWKERGAGGSKRAPASDRTKSDAGNTQGGRTSLFYDGFEGPFIVIWESYDNDPGNGEDYWGPIYDPQAQDGSYSAWCAADGDMPDGYYYDNYMDACMEMIYPVATWGYTNSRLSFMLDLQTEVNYDWLM
ncbi:MAG: hypothetical protein ACOY58_03080, partial [Candidatus Micrarchaeota archaeon]